MAFRRIPLQYAFYSTAYRRSTIFAVSSGQGKCGVAVIRVSGPQAGTTLKHMTELKNLPKPRHALLRAIRHVKNKDIIDKGLVLWFPGPNSFTGEDTCEFQVHGGTAVIAAVLDSLGSIENVRLAEAGEFTRRAFYNGKLDLTEVEGIADLIAAETEIQRKQAFLQTDGNLSKLYQEWKKKLVQCLANVEAYIDFEETENIETDLLEHVVYIIKDLKSDIDKHLNDGRKGERLRDGVKTVILGEPNVGKSSLLNTLCQRPAAIVTPIEGTTRDVLEITLNIGGYPLILMDTAGLRANATDIIEKEGINRAIKAYQQADLVFLLIDCQKYLEWYRHNKSNTFQQFLKEYLGTLDFCDLDIICNKSCVTILNKIDLISPNDRHLFENLNATVISCKSENGLPLLLEQTVSHLELLCGKPSKEHPSITQMRHRECLTKCSNYLENFLNEQLETTDLVLMAEEIRKAVRQLGKITGVVTTEQLLDVIFKEFCIGK